MKCAIIQLPGLNRDRDMFYALKQITGKEALAVWETETSIPNVDLIVIPGGFSYGDYLRCGAIAARAPVMEAVRKKAKEGVRIIGICNGFQILIEAGLLPGALLANKGTNFICKHVSLEVTNNNTDFTRQYDHKQIITCPIAHGEGNYYASDDDLKRLEDNAQIVFRYADGGNPNGSALDIAGIINKEKNVLGMMPHPENYIESEHGGDDGRLIFTSALGINSHDY